MLKPEFISRSQNGYEIATCCIRQSQRSFRSLNSHEHLISHKTMTKEIVCLVAGSKVVF